MVRQRQVAVVAAQHQVITHGDPPESRSGRRLNDGDQAEIRGAATDVADQDQLTGTNLAQSVQISQANLTTTGGNISVVGMTNGSGISLLSSRLIANGSVTVNGSGLQQGLFGSEAYVKEHFGGYDDGPDAYTQAVYETMFSGDRARPVTWCPWAISSLVVSDPMKPAAPVTNTCMKALPVQTGGILLRFACR